MVTVKMGPSFAHNLQHSSNPFVLQDLKQTQAFVLLMLLQRDILSPISFLGTISLRAFLLCKIAGVLMAPLSRWDFRFVAEPMREMTVTLKNFQIEPGQGLGPLKCPGKGWGHSSARASVDHTLHPT